MTVITTDLFPALAPLIRDGRIFATVYQQPKSQGRMVAGYKPIVEIQFADYLWPAAMQLRDEIPTVRWRSNGVWTRKMPRG